MNTKKDSQETAINYIKKHLKTIENFVNNKDNSTTYKQADEAMFALKDFLKKNSINDFPKEVIDDYCYPVIKSYLNDERSGMPDGFVEILEENNSFKRNLGTNAHGMSEEIKKKSIDIYTRLGDIQLNYNEKLKRINKNRKTG